MLVSISSRRRLFIKAPISVHQLCKFSKYGVSAVRIFWYIRLQEGKLVSEGLLKPKEHTFIKLDNKSLEPIADVHRSHKWERLKALESNTAYKKIY